MTPEEFTEFIYKNADSDYGILPPPIDAQTGLDVLIHHFLGDDWYSISLIHTEQVNTEAIHEILRKYPRKESIIKRVSKLVKNRI